MSNSKYRKGGQSSGQAGVRVDADVPEALFAQFVQESPRPQVPMDEDPMPKHICRRLMANGAMLMNHIGNLCGRAIDAIPLDMANTGHAQEVAREVEQVMESSDGKIKRARPHSLMSLMRTALSAMRLMYRLLQGTNPEMFAKPLSVKQMKKALAEAGELADKIEERSDAILT